MAGERGACGAGPASEHCTPLNAGPARLRDGGCTPLATPRAMEEMRNSGHQDQSGTCNHRLRTGRGPGRQVPEAAGVDRSFPVEGWDGLLLRLHHRVGVPKVGAHSERPCGRPPNREEEAAFKGKAAAGRPACGPSQIRDPRPRATPEGVGPRQDTPGRRPGGRGSAGTPGQRGEPGDTEAAGPHLRGEEGKVPSSSQEGPPARGPRRAAGKGVAAPRPRAGASPRRRAGRPGASPRTSPARARQVGA